MGFFFVYCFSNLPRSVSFFLIINLCVYDVVFLFVCLFVWKVRIRLLLCLLQTYKEEE